MGGIWGTSAATALENLPVEVRGVASGVLQQGYAMGYLIAAIINLFLVPEVSAGWRALFWTSSALTLIAAAIGAYVPESDVFLKVRSVQKSRGMNTNATQKTKIFLRETKAMLRKHWLLFIYAIFFMTGMCVLLIHLLKL